MNTLLLEASPGLNLTSRVLPLNTALFLLTAFIPRMTLAITIVGIFGFVGNAITFLQVELRTNTCCIYIFCSSVVDLIHLMLNVFPDYLRATYGVVNPWAVNDFMCRLYNFIYSFLPQLAINLLILSIIDRYACTCPLASRLHRLNELKMVPRLIAGVMVISAVLSIYAPAMTALFSLGCGIYLRRAFGICNICINGIMQPVVMLVFVLLTYRNVLVSRKRVVRNASMNERRRNSRVCRSK